MLVARSAGVLAADVRPLVRLSVQVIVEHDGRREQAARWAEGGSTTPLTDDLLEDYARKAVHQAVVNLDARPAPAGPMTVVLGPGLARAFCCTKPSATGSG